MNEQTLEFFQELANTTSEHLWAALVAQAPISSSVNLCIMLLWIGVGLFCFRKGISQKTYEDDRNCWLFVALLFLIALVFVLAVVGPSIFAGFFNPEYWALEKAAQLANGVW